MSEATILNIGKPTKNNPKPLQRFRVIVQLKGSKKDNQAMRSFTIHDYNGKAKIDQVKKKLVKGWDKK